MVKLCGLGFKEIFILQLLMVRVLLCRRIVNIAKSGNHFIIATESEMSLDNCENFMLHNNLNAIENPWLICTIHN